MSSVSFMNSSKGEHGVNGRRDVMTYEFQVQNNVSRLLYFGHDFGKLRTVFPKLLALC